MINKTAVCQGYASLFYRLALDAGVDTRVISGEAGGPHAWNIVKLMVNIIILIVHGMQEEVHMLIS